MSCTPVTAAMADVLEALRAGPDDDEKTTNAVDSQLGPALLVESSLNQGIQSAP